MYISSIFFEGKFMFLCIIEKFYVYLCLKIRRTSLHCLIIKKMFPNSSTLRVFAGFEEAAFE
ncbi:MAG: hypothetical protein LBU51_04600, partial [Bacteroidales bacterium]|nr:hypothetical protein [Bacteroidales bacterium]